MSFSDNQPLHGRPPRDRRPTPPLPRPINQLGNVLVIFGVVSGTASVGASLLDPETVHTMPALVDLVQSAWFLATGAISLVVGGVMALAGVRR